MEVTATWPSILTSTWWLDTSSGAKGKCPGRTRNGRSTTMKPSPRALENMPSKPAARITSDLFIARLVGIPAEMLPLFPKRRETEQVRCGGNRQRRLVPPQSCFPAKFFHEAKRTRALLRPLWAHFVMSSEYASPARTETSLVIPMQKNQRFLDLARHEKLSDISSGTSRVP